jgi:hypothetical protein
LSTDIRGLMQFEQAQIETLTLTPNEKKEPTASLKLSAELTPQLAETLGCRAAIFRSDDKPHARVTRFDLGGMILRDIELSLPNPHNDGAFDTYRPEDLASFRVEVDGMLARLLMLARIKGRFLELVDFLSSTNTDQFEMAIRSLQNEFDFTGKSGGTRVDMSGNQNVAAGKAEENGPLFQAPDDAAADPAPESDGASQELADDLVDVITAPREPILIDGREMGIARIRQQLTRGDGYKSPEDIRREQLAGDGLPVVDEPVIPVGE